MEERKEEVKEVRKGEAYWNGGGIIVGCGLLDK